MRNDDTPSSPRGGLFCGWGHDFAVAGVFLTRLPFRPKGDVALSDLADAGRVFPLIGVLVGGVGAGVLMLMAALDLHPLACAFMGLAAMALVTGGLHEDGLADVADGFGGGADRDAKMRIMRDSRIGAFGVLALVFSVAIKASILSGLAGPGLAASALVASAILSRAILPAVMLALPAARGDGLAAGAGRPIAQTAMLALVIGTVLAGFILGLGVGVVALLGVVASAAIIGFLANRQIGGYTGDVLGTVQQLAEISVLITAGAFAL